MSKVSDCCGYPYDEDSKRCVSCKENCDGVQE